ncbi:hypothetical protein C8R47DRAFT_1216434 [Mycena vitilis]|nr:hypothetical protein C8R47DRAFT_1216434 [Mycena vitilis]
MVGLHQLHMSVFRILQRLTLLVSAGPDSDAGRDAITIDTPLLRYAQVQFPCLEFTRPLEHLATFHYQHQTYLAEAERLRRVLTMVPKPPGSVVRLLGRLGKRVVQPSSAALRHAFPAFVEIAQALQCIDVLPHLKHLELPRIRHTSLESLELFLGPLPTSCSAAELVEFRALAEAGMQLRITALQQTNNRWFVVPFLPTQQAPS